MQKFYLDSFKELKVTQNLVLCGLMAALAVFALLPHYDIVSLGRG